MLFLGPLLASTPTCSSPACSLSAAKSSVPYFITFRWWSLAAVRVEKCALKWMGGLGRGAVERGAASWL